MEKAQGQVIRLSGWWQTASGLNHYKVTKNSVWQCGTSSSIHQN